MPARNPKEVFLMLLSNARQNTERAAKRLPGDQSSSRKPRRA